MLSYRARKSHWKVKCGFSFGSSKYCGSSCAGGRSGDEQEQGEGR